MSGPTLSWLVNLVECVGDQIILPTFKPFSWPFNPCFSQADAAQYSTTMTIRIDSVGDLCICCFPANKPRENRMRGKQKKLTFVQWISTVQMITKKHENMKQSFEDV
jgi:hypothetical protein